MFIYNKIKTSKSKTSMKNLTYIRSTLNWRYFIFILKKEISTDGTIIVLFHSYDAFNYIYCMYKNIAYMFGMLSRELDFSIFRFSNINV